MRQPTLIDYIFLVVLALIWASAFFNIKIATYTYDTFTLVFVRVFFAALALVLWCFYKKIKIMAFSKEWKLYALVGLVNISFPFLLIAYGTDKVQSYLSAILMSSTPLSGAILAHFFIRNRRTCGLLWIAALSRVRMHIGNRIPHSLKSLEIWLWI